MTPILYIRVFHDIVSVVEKEGTCQAIGIDDESEEREKYYIIETRWLHGKTSME